MHYGQYRDVSAHKKTKVLVVDDDRVIQELCRIALAGVGIETLSCSSGEQAIDVFQARHDEVGLVLVDYAMPGLNGVETSERLRAIAPDTRQVSITGSDDPKVLALLEEAQLTPALPKPFAVQDLIDRAKRELGAAI